MLNGELLGGGVLTGQIGRDVITISKEEQEVIIEPRREQFDVYPDVGKVIKKATVKAVTSDIDENIVARNIRGGVTILGVTGDLEPDKPDQSKVVEPSTSEQVVTADSGFELASVTVKPVTAEIDSDIVAENIRKDTEILGVVGTMEAREDLDTELAEQESLLAELESGVDELPEKPVDKLQYKCDNLKSLYNEFYVRGGENFANYTDDTVTQIMNGIDTSNVVDMDYMLASQGTTKYVDLSNIILDMSNCKTSISMLANHNGLIKPPKIVNINKLEKASSMFSNCASLTDLSELKMEHLTESNSMFYGCLYLTKLPELNMSQITNAYNMFCKCSSITSLPQLVMSKLSNGSNMFNGCTSLTEITELTMPDSANINSMFYGCTSLLRIPKIMTDNMRDFGGIFYNCKLLETIELTSVIKSTTFNNTFYGCTNLKNLTLKNIKVSLQIGRGTSFGTLLTDESIINTFQELHDMTGSTAKTLTLSTPSYERAEAIYVKLIDITDEMRAEDEYIDNKKPCVVCESTDEGAMTLKEYGISKNWNIAK